MGKVREDVPWRSFDVAINATRKLTGDGGHGGDDGNHVDAPVPDIVGVVRPLGVEVEPHLDWTARVLVSVHP